MPDLSKRPERYATALIATVLAGSFAYSALGVRFGADPRLAELQAKNKQLQHQLQSAAPKITTVRPVPAAIVSHRDCSSFPNQEAAQAFWKSHRSQYPNWDGNHNGVACEQLKHAKQVGPSHVHTPGSTALTVTQTAAQLVSQNRTAQLTEPKSPPQTLTLPVAAKPTAPSKATIVASRQHFGLYTATPDEYTGLESTLARDTTMNGYFQGWDTNFRPDNVNSAWSHGQIPFLTWESRSMADAPSAVDYSLDNIAAGGFDAYIRKYALDIKANGLPLVIRFDQEMNGNWYRWAEPDPNYTNSKGSYIAAWRHVHDIFQAEGANNLVIWDWSPNRIDNITRMPSIDNYYPGDAYTDWVGMTGYYRPGDKAPTFDSTYSATLAALRRVAPHKPILLSEVGATEIGGQKLNWVTDFFPGLARNPDVIGFVWFNYAVTASGVTNDWRIQSTTAVTNAFRAGLYATGFGRDHGKKPILVTTVPTATPSSTSAGPSPNASPSPSSTPSSSAKAQPTSTAHSTATSSPPASNAAPSDRASPIG
jgi:mannan endo-1,4-beta-mannosidase